MRFDDQSIDEMTEHLKSNGWVGDRSMVTNLLNAASTETSIRKFLIHFTDFGFDNEAIDALNELIAEYDQANYDFSPTGHALRLSIAKDKTAKSSALCELRIATGVLILNIYSDHKSEKSLRQFKPKAHQPNFFN